MRSKKPIPAPIFSRLGASIKNIRSVDDSFSFTIAYQEVLRSTKNRKYRYDEDIAIYLGSDGHLYIPDNEIYLLSLDVLTLFTEDCDCEDGCKSAWDYEFIVPDRFLMNVVDLTSQKLLTYKQLPADQKPDDIATFYDGTEITGRDGDGLSIMIYFKCTPSSINSELDIWIDIGGAVGELYRETKYFRGTAVKSVLYTLPAGYTRATWEANGGIIYVKPSVNMTFYGMNYNFLRTHKAK